MLFVDDLKWAIRVMLHPDKNTSKTMDSVGAFIKYYKASFIPLLIALLLEIALAGILAAVIASILHSLFMLLLGPIIKLSPYYANLINAALAELVGALALGLLLSGTIFFVWIAIPVYLCVTSLVYWVIGRWILKLWDSEYDNTATAFIYSAAPLAVFAWTIAIPLVGSFIILPLLLTWQFIILVFALSKQIGISRRIAAIFAFVVGIITWIVDFALGI